jgi:hypothetical protein
VEKEICQGRHNINRIKIGVTHTASSHGRPGNHINARTMSIREGDDIDVGSDEPCTGSGLSSLKDEEEGEDIPVVIPLKNEGEDRIS